MVLQEEELKPKKSSAGNARWLTLLENELKGRVGWVDEAISPFALACHASDLKDGLRRAA